MDYAWTSEWSYKLFRKKIFFNTVPYSTNQFDNPIKFSCEYEYRYIFDCVCMYTNTIFNWYSNVQFVCDRYVTKLSTKKNIRSRFWFWSHRTTINIWSEGPWTISALPFNFRRISSYVITRLDYVRLSYLILTTIK